MDKEKEEKEFLKNLEEYKRRFPLESLFVLKEPVCLEYKINNEVK